MIVNYSIGFNSLQQFMQRDDPDAIKVVAKEMESLFVYEMLKAMRETTETFTKGGLGGSTYMSLFDMEIARTIAEKGLGIQDMLVRSINKEGTLNKKDLAINEKSTDKGNIGNSSTDLKMPVGGVISSNYGFRVHPIFGDYRFHSGIDISAPEGTEIYPVKGGRVVFSGQKSGYGNVIEIDHGDGFVSLYAHNKVNFVKEGDEVTPDTIIAQVGSSGSSTGPHLHLELRYNGGNINPIKFISMR